MTGVVHRWSARFSTLVSAALLLGAGAGCVDYLEPGEFGTLRYFGEVRGEVPVRLLPPVVDQEGNTYVLYGGRDTTEVETWVGHADGGWTSSCQIHEGDDLGSYGWIGVADDRAWYWSGHAIVEVEGATGGCRQVARQDSATNSTLLTSGAAPWVKFTGNRTTAVAVMTGREDSRSYVAVLDLEAGRPSSFEEIADADGVEVIGTGANPKTGLSVFALAYDRSGTRVAEVRWIDEFGVEIGRVGVDGLASYGQGAALGWLQLSDSGEVAGLLEDGKIIVVEDGIARVQDSPEGISPVGVHRWEGRIWLVGTDGAGRPVVARIRGSAVDPATPWTASLDAADALAPGHEVLDDRNEPRIWVDWESPVTAIGSWPFLSPHGPTVTAPETTVWLVAGPSFDVNLEARTAIAAGPVGLSYP